MSNLPDYYKILGISVSATQKDIREAYRRESLKTHPDRVSDPSQKRRATENFQKVADAYYVLQDPDRRSNYDSQRASRPHMFTGTSGASSADYFNQFFRTAPGAFPDNTAEDPEEETLHPDPNATFGDAFEDLLQPEVNRLFPMWTWAGAGAGAILGFIAGNLPGAAIGAYGGSRLGAVRDAKGKAFVLSATCNPLDRVNRPLHSVYEVFMSLNGGQRAAILRSLATKVLGQMAS